MRALDLIGRKFGRLIALSRVGSNKHGQPLWKCHCSCGGEAVTTASKLTSGHTRSCGCIKADRMRSYRRKRQDRRPCAAEGCQRESIYASGMYCGMHLARLKRAGRLTLIRRRNGTGNINAGGYIDVTIGGRRTYEHILVAEKALGHCLPKGAVVHHVNENRADNRPENLVICPDEAYHRLLHRLMKERKALAAL